MMHTVKRVTKEGAAIQVMVSPTDQSGTPQVAQGFVFFPAGSSDGPSAAVMPDWAAKELMLDRGIAHHFTCEPPLGEEGTPEATKAPPSKRSAAS